MRKFSYIFLFLILTIFYTVKAEALNISYESVLGINGNNILVEKYLLEKKTNYMCSALSYTCKITTTKSLPSTSGMSNDPIAKSLRSKKATHITISPLKNFVAYLIHDTNGSSRKLVIRDINTGKEKNSKKSLEYWDLLNDQDSVFGFTPDESKLIYLDDSEGYFSLYQSDKKNFMNNPFRSSKINTNTLEIHQFTIFDNNTVFYIGNTLANPYTWSLYKFDLNTNTNKKIADNVSYTSSIRKLNGKIIFAMQESVGFGPRIYDLKEDKIHYFNIPNVNRVINKSNEQIINFGKRYGVLMKPPVTAQPTTLVVWLHGGPYRQTSYGYHPYHSYGTYDSILEAMRVQGTLVLKLDYSGSLGFGRSYSESVGKNVGSGDVSDVLDAVDFIKTKYSINNVYLIGNSYGGYLSLKTITDNSSKFTGSISINGVTDWEALLSYMNTSIFNTHFGGLPNTNNQYLYDNASIIKNISKLDSNKPLMIIQAAADRTVAPWQATLLGDALKKEKKNVKMISYPKEDHVWKYEKNIRDMCTQMFKFVGIKNTSSCTN